ncbi:ATP-dependent DNA ligase [Candidatus Woesearchaeota archaeon]|nr:ATP-dependent DNA ligase [Candidatus Woesearchaeota archaeon]
MEYSELAKVYEQLESTTKRLEKTWIISGFLKKAVKSSSGTDKNEIYMLSMLLQGRVFPPWDERRLGVAARMIIKAVSVATGADASGIESEWKDIGDIGKVAEKLVSSKRQTTLFSQALSVEKVFSNLQKLPSLEGQGSVDQKIQLIAELLTSAEPIEARYIVRTVLEDLRVGVADGTLRDAIVWAFFSDSISINYDEEKKTINPDDREEYNKYVDAVQSAYDVCNDFSRVIESARSGGLEAIRKIGLDVGKPIKVMLYQKATGIENAFERVGKPAAFEYKYDGFRCITGHTPIYVYKKGLISVKDVKKEDLVLSHKGYFRRVEAVNKRRIDKKERLFKIQSFLGNQFRISEGHKILVERHGKVRWVNSESLTRTDHVVFPIPRFRIKDQPAEKELVLKNASNYSKSIKISNDFFRFLGYWIGDGFTNDYHNTERVGLVFNKNDKNKINKYSNIIQRDIKIDRITQSRQRGMISLYWRDKPLRIWLSTNFRREWKGKMIPDWFYNISKSQFLAFLEGWTESDGHTDSAGRTSITTKERDLAMFAQLIGLKQGIIIALKKIRIYGKTYYKLIILKSEKHYKLRSDYLAVKILKYEEIKYPDPRTMLYNIQVKGDKSYCTTLLSLHNCQIHKNNPEIKIYTRRLEDVTKQFPEVKKYVEENIKGEGFILDSEAVGYDPKTGEYLPFQSISQRIKRKHNIDEMAGKYPVELNIFDVVSYEGKNMMKEPFRKRRELIESIVTEEPKKIVLAKQIITDDPEEAERFYKESLNAGEEGVMAKNLDGAYKPGSRVGFGVKIKPVMETLDLTIVGAEWGTGKRSGWLSSFVLACRDDSGEFFEIGKVGTGIKELEGTGVTFDYLTELLKPLVIDEKGRQVRIKPSVVVEINYEEIQKSPTYSSGFALRFPRLIKLREDRGPEDVSSISFIEELYYGQK